MAIKNLNSVSKSLRSGKGSVMIASVLLMMVAAFTSLGWVYYVNESSRAAHIDRQRTWALYAADAGIEQVVDYFNNPEHFTGNLPSAYDTEASHPSRYPLRHPVAPSSYMLFEPYILAYALDEDDQPVYEDGAVIPTIFTFFQNTGAGNARAVSLTSKIPSCTLDLSDAPDLIHRDGASDVELARTASIRLVHPTELDAAGQLPTDRRVICKVISTGRTPDGVEVTVESILSENPTLNISAPGSIISDASITYNGNFNAFWGEVWSRADVQLPTNWLQKMPRDNGSTIFDGRANPPLDTWFKLRTTGVFRNSGGTQFADGRVNGGFTATTIPSSAGNYYKPFLESLLFRDRRGRSDFEDLENLEQHQNLPFPEYSYNDWKRFVSTYGFPYYFTYTDGNVWGVENDESSPNYGRLVGKSYHDWFNVSTSDPDYASVEKMIVFVDSVPVNNSGQVAPMVGGVPLINSEYYPRDPSTTPSRMTDIRISGQGTHTRGAMFVAANLDMTGQGNPPSWNNIPDSIGGVLMPNAQDPPSNTSMNIFHYGFLCCWGSVAGGGNRTIYGSVYTRTGYAANGSPQVYYNYRLRDGSWLNLNASRVLRNQWNIVR